MAISTTPASGELRLALDDILVGDNVRDLDAAHVDNLAQSIALRGLLVPLIVRPTTAGYELVAGYHRYQACRKLGLDDAPVVVREKEGSTADSAAENVARKQLTPLEEAKAVQAMLNEGYTLDGAAQALGWSRQLATARAKILKLPEAGQRLVGTGEIPVSAIDTLLAIADVSPQIAEAVVATIASGSVAGSQLVNNAGWAIGQALHNAEKNTFGAYLNTLHHGDLRSLRLGRKTDALVVEAEKLHKQVEQYAYGPPTFRFDTSDVDQARAGGVLIELDGSAPIITHLALYRELAKQAIMRTVEQLRERGAAKAKSKRAREGQRERTPREELDVEHRANLRELTRQAHGTNLDLGAALLTELAAVAPDDMDVARVFALCRRRHSVNYAKRTTMPIPLRVALPWVLVDRGTRPVIVLPLAATPTPGRHERSLTRAVLVADEGRGAQAQLRELGAANRRTRVRAYVVSAMRVTPIGSMSSERAPSSTVIAPLSQVASCIWYSMRPSRESSSRNRWISRGM